MAKATFQCVIEVINFVPLAHHAIHASLYGIDEYKGITFFRGMVALGITPSSLMTTPRAKQAALAGARYEWPPLCSNKMPWRRKYPKPVVANHDITGLNRLHTLGRCREI